MLAQLTVKNHTLVESLNIEFQPGLIAITGETGTGKSILMNALGLTLGDRADSDQIRAGAERTEICALFDLSELPNVREYLQQQSLDEDDQCLLRRVINANGSSRAWVNSQPVTLKLLRQLAEQLINIHSQHEHQRLLNTSHQRQLLDSQSGATEALESTARAFHGWQDAQARLTELEQRIDQHLARRDLLRYQVDELRQLALEENEFSQLEQEQRQLSNAEQSLAQLHQAENLLSGDQNLTILNQTRQLGSLLQNLQLQNSSLDEAQSLIESSLVQLEEARDSLRQTRDAIELDPQKLLEVEARISAAFELSRKHRVEPAELANVAQLLTQELESLVDIDTSLDALRQEVEKLEANYFKDAQSLSELRQQGAKQLETAVDAEFALLSMGGAQLSIALNPQQPSARGLESIDFLVATNPGQTPKPLAKIASGGELSRISLAIQMINSRYNPGATLVFDEIDAGIGGATAAVIGEKLHDLGERHQVLCITHLAQVAARADTQLSVTKTSGAGRTQTRISELDMDSRTREIARMLSGDSDSQRSLEHAKELLQETA